MVIKPQKSDLAVNFLRHCHYVKVLVSRVCELVFVYFFPSQIKSFVAIATNTINPCLLLDKFYYI